MKNDIINRIEKLEKNSHPPVDWEKKIDKLSERIKKMTNLILTMKKGDRDAK